MYDLLRERAAWALDPALDLTRDLIRAPSESLGEATVSGLIERAFHQSGAFDRVFRDAFGNVVGVMFGFEAGPTVLLTSHLDTVPVLSPEQWAQSPYSAAMDNGRIAGLGAADCKGGLAAQLFAAVALRRSLLPLRGNLVVAATVAEENGVGVGTRLLVERTLPDLDFSVQYAIVPEPTNLGLYYGHDGWVALDIQISGRDLFQVTDASRAVFDHYSTPLAPAPTPGQKQQTTVAKPSVSGTNGSTRALVRLQRRLLMGESLDNVLKEVRQASTESARPAGSVGIDIDVSEERQQLATGHTRSVRRLASPWLTDPFSTLPRRAFQALSVADCPARTGQWTLDRLGMGTPGCTLVTELGIPTIGYGPGREEMAHACNEYVETEKIGQASYGTAAIVHSLIGVPVFGWTADEI
ncbi:MAG: M20/M25/M40 family metallo-hydrolase [Polyangiaceae bacterium]|nr:M20/M25/M40 family metallo-hydrolase [Polyangiaceae bacterium]